MPNKRIVDIYNKEPKPENKAVLEKTEEHPKEVSFPKPGKKKLFWIFGIFALGILAILFFALPKAEVSYWPQTDPLNLETTLTIDVSSQEINVDSRTIPGAFFDKEQTVTEEFQATGHATREGKASGKITVYNEYSTNSQLFVSTTRFVSAEGKVFRTPVAVTIPGGHYEGGKLVPGEKEIEVTADESGPEYNIGATTFSIPGLAGTAKYTKFYAKSSQPMTGGFLAGASFVTEDDIDDAKTSVTGKAKDQAEEALLSGLGAEEMKDYISIENAVNTKIMEESSSALKNQEAGSFTYRAKARSRTMVFKKDDLKEFAKQFLESKMTEGMAIYEESIEIDYVQESINIDSGKIIISAVISAKSYLEIDENNLRSLIAGKSLAGSKVIAENQIGVTKAEVDFWPFWVKTAPNNQDKIEVQMKID
ncbi:MAG: hypothetical protein WC302_01840 [Candidatus Paceibacterota bacterium]|jgi:hypothetical protein